MKDNQSINTEQMIYLTENWINYSYGKYITAVTWSKFYTNLRNFTHSRVDKPDAGVGGEGQFSLTPRNPNDRFNLICEPIWQF